MYQYLTSEQASWIAEALTPHFLAQDQKAIMQALDQTVSVVLDQIDLSLIYQFMSDIQSPAGADMVGITDVGTFFTGTSVEDALQELGTGLQGKQPLDATLTALAAQNWVANSVPVGTGADTLTQLAIGPNQFVARNSVGGVNVHSISDFTLNLLDETTAPNWRSGLGLVAVASSGSASDLTTGTLPAGRMPALTGDVTTTVGNVATTITNDVVTNTKLSNMGANSIKANPTASVADPQDVGLAANQILGRSSTGNLSGKGVTDFGFDILAINGAYQSFTPTVLGTTVAGVGTYTTQQGYYARIGPIVFFKLIVEITGHTGSGNLRIGNLPFTAANDINAPVSVHYVNNLVLTAGNIVSGAVLVNTNQVQLGQQAVGGGAFAAVPLDTSFGLGLAGFYFV